MLSFYCFLPLRPCEATVLLPSFILLESREEGTYSLDQGLVGRSGCLLFVRGDWDFQCSAIVSLSSTYDLCLCVCSSFVLSPQGFVKLKVIWPQIETAANQSITFGRPGPVAFCIRVYSPSPSPTVPLAIVILADGHVQRRGRLERTGGDAGASGAVPMMVAHIHSAGCLRTKIFHWR